MAPVDVAVALVAVRVPWLVRSRPLEVAQARSQPREQALPAWIGPAAPLVPERVRRVPARVEPPAAPAERDVERVLVGPLELVPALGDEVDELRRLAVAPHRGEVEQEHPAVEVRVAPGQA